MAEILRYYISAEANRALKDFYEEEGTEDNTTVCTMLNLGDQIRDTGI